MFAFREADLVRVRSVFAHRAYPFLCSLVITNERRESKRKAKKKREKIGKSANQVIGKSDRIKMSGFPDFPMNQAT